MNTGTLPSRLIMIGVTLAASFMLGACASKPTVKNFNMTIAPQTSQKVEVDILAVSQAEAEELDKVDIDSYFSGGDSFRASKAGTARTFTFNEGQNTKVTIDSKDAIWKTWGATRPYIYILANSRALRASAQKGTDVRRKKIERWSDYWTQDNFEVSIKDGGIFVEPAPVKIVK